GRPEDPVSLASLREMPDHCVYCVQAIPGGTIADFHLLCGAGDLREEGAKNAVELPDQIRAPILQDEPMGRELGVEHVQEIVAIVPKAEVSRLQNLPVT